MLFERRSTVVKEVGRSFSKPGESFGSFIKLHGCKYLILFQPFWKVTGDGSSVGYGVVGVLEANFIESAHDKQDFERSSLFCKLETKLKQMIMDYWKCHCHLVGHRPVVSRLHAKQCKSTMPSHVKVADMQSKSTVPSQVKVADMQTQLSTGKTVNDLPVIDLSAESNDNERGKDSSKTAIDKIREENRHLFMRCEEYLQKENELLSTVEELKKELAETKAKSAQLSLHLEAQRKLKRQPMHHI